MVGVMSARVLSILFDPFPESVTEWLQKFSAGAVFYGAGCLCVMRARSSGAEGFAWRALALAMFMWGTGDLYFAGVLSERDVVPYPSLADALWLGFYLPAYAAIASLLRRRVGFLSRGAGLDALIGGLGVGSAGATLAFGVALDNTTGSAAAIATNLAYPVGDLGLLALIGAAITVTGWKAAGGWRWIAVAFAIFAVADSIFLVQVARGTYATGALVDLGWPTAALLIGLLAWRDAPLDRVGVRTETGMVIPAISGFAALVLLVVDHFVTTNLLALGLATTSILLILMRQFLAVRDNGRLLHQSRQDATTDALTGLGNRRQLASDLARHVGKLDPDRPMTLTLFDLDGFKQYNDTFGHPAGDELLERLGGRLREAVKGRGAAYRMGGDEFCVLWTTLASFQPDLATLDAVAALSERGEAFSIACSHGSVLLPTETSDPTEALRVADRRMYIRKRSGRTSAGWQMVDVLHQVLAETERHLGDHIAGEVRDLAVATATRLELSQEDLELTVQTALLHDLGRVAIPDQILNKSGPLNEAEWAFMKQQTTIAERIISAAPSLAGVAKLVRATQERHDGTGYPDGLRADEIPLISRIVAVCAAFHAMTTEHPSRTKCSRSEAIAELRRGSGTQFDPDVVDAFLVAVESQIDGLPLSPLPAM
jgi:diguanylate cyclase (GGDEF)-like protein